MVAQEQAGKLIERATKALESLGIVRDAISEFVWDQIRKRAGSPEKLSLPSHPRPSRARACLNKTIREGAKRSGRACSKLNRGAPLQRTVSTSRMKIGASGGARSLGLCACTLLLLAQQAGQPVATQTKPLIHHASVLKPTPRCSSSETQPSFSQLKRSPPCGNRSCPRHTAQPARVRKCSGGRLGRPTRGLQADEARAGAPRLWRSFWAVQTLMCGGALT
jgi:hypothetical protein